MDTSRARNTHITRMKTYVMVELLSPTAGFARPFVSERSLARRQVAVLHIVIFMFKPFADPRLYGNAHSHSVTKMVLRSYAISMHLLWAGLAGVVLSIAMPVPDAPAQAQSWPTRPIRLVVGFPPGGSGDFIARNMSEEIPFWEKVVRESGATTD